MTQPERRGDDPQSQPPPGGWAAQVHNHRRGVSAQYQGGRLMSQREVENDDLSGKSVADLVVTLGNALDQLADLGRGDHDRIALRAGALWRELTFRGLEL